MQEIPDPVIPAVRHGMVSSIRDILLPGGGGLPADHHSDGLVILLVDGLGHAALVDQAGQPAVVGDSHQVVYAEVYGTYPPRLFCYRRQLRHDLELQAETVSPVIRSDSSFL